MRRDVVAPKGYMQPGDTVVCEIEGIGRLQNRVAAARGQSLVESGTAAP
jgi:2-keto-4-pentenoate hydratase/2-oxohepta-3-ene-1,7-dioic acid hydratase in catechol pathway